MVFQSPPGRIERAAYGSLKVSIGAMADYQFFSLYLQLNSKHCMHHPSDGDRQELQWLFRSL